MGGDVLQTDERQRIVMGAMTVVAHERAVGALRMVELRARKAVIDEQHHALLQDIGDTSNPGLGLEIYFGGGGRWQGAGLDAPPDRCVRRFFLPAEPIILPGDM